MMMMMMMMKKNLKPKKKEEKENHHRNKCYFSHCQTEPTKLTNRVLSHKETQQKKKKSLQPYDGSKKEKTVERNRLLSLCMLTKAG